MVFGEILVFSPCWCVLHLLRFRRTEQNTSCHPLVPHDSKECAWNLMPLRSRKGRWANFEALPRHQRRDDDNQNSN